MTRSDLVTSVAEKTKMTKKDSEKIINAITETITEALVDGDYVRLLGFGTFRVKERAARMGRNPKTKERVSIPPSKAPVFKYSKALKDFIECM